MKTEFKYKIYTLKVKATSPGYRAYTTSLIVRAQGPKQAKECALSELQKAYADDFPDVKLEVKEVKLLKADAYLNAELEGKKGRRQNNG